MKVLKESEAIKELKGSKGRRGQKVRVICACCNLLKAFILLTHLIMSPRTAEANMIKKLRPGSGINKLQEVLLNKTVCPIMSFNPNRN